MRPEEVKKMVRWSYAIPTVLVLLATVLIHGSLAGCSSEDELSGSDATATSDAGAGGAVDGGDTSDGSTTDGGDASQDADTSCSIDAFCAEGSFCRLATRECLPLAEPSCSVADTPGCYGFRDFSPAGGASTVSTCTQAAVQSAIDDAFSAGGGFVQVDAAACPTIDINRLVLRSNVILEGGGTTFVVVVGAIPDPQLGIITDNFLGTAVQNIVARNFTLECASTDDLGLVTAGDSGATNVLLEHLTVVGAWRNSIDLHNCRNCTARHNRIYGATPASTHAAGHGFGTGMGAIPHRVQLYSNEIYDLTREGFYAFDIHRGSDSVEIAGNLMSRLMLGTKIIDDSRNVYFHHNDWDTIDGPAFVNYSHADSERIRALRVHHDTISDAAGAFRLSWGTAGAWQIEGLELWNNEITDSSSDDGCTTTLLARTTGVSVRGSHGNICTIGDPVEWSCDADPPCDESP